MPQPIQQNLPRPHEPQTAMVPFTLSPNFAWAPSFTSLDSQGKTVPSIDPSQLKLIGLVGMGYLLAQGLALILDQLKDCDEEVVAPITSVLNPYFRADQDLYVRMPPISSRRGVMHVTRRGKALPKV